MLSTVCAAAALLIIPAGAPAQEAPAAAPEAPAETSAASADEAVDEDGNTPLIRAAMRLNGLMRISSPVPPEVWKEAEDEVFQLLAGGADPLRENNRGCNALFFLHANPDWVERLRRENLLPPELAVRIPTGRTEFLHYISLRAAQARMPHTVSLGDRGYLSRRYCQPAYGRCRDLVEELLNGHGHTDEDTAALADALEVMRAADEGKAGDYIDSLPLWQHGEQMMQPVPLALLQALQDTRWTPNVANIRTALDKLASMLPASKEDMIDCAAARPVRVLLHLLVYQEGPRAMPELERLAKAYDPDAACAAMELMLRLRGGRYLPELPLEPSTPFERLAEAYRVDDAVYHGNWRELDPAAILRAAECMRSLEGTPCPLHAAMLEGMVKDGQLAVAEDDALNLRYRYEEIDEPAPRRCILSHILAKYDTYFPTHPAPQPQQP